MRRMSVIANIATVMVIYSLPLDLFLHSFVFHSFVYYLCISFLKLFICSYLDTHTHKQELQCRHAVIDKREGGGGGVESLRRGE